MRILLLLAVFLFSLTAVAQRIQVLEKGTNDPVFGVVVYNKSKAISTTTDFDGFVDISRFSKSELIIFQHISHVTRSVTKKQIESFGNLVLMSPITSQLDEVILSVAKFGQIKRDIPQQIVSVGSEDVLFSNPQTAADLLKNSGQVYIQKSQLGGGSPNIRGFSTNRLLITVDGVRFNTAIFRSGNVQNVISIDPFAVENTEVILRPRIGCLRK